MLKTVGAKVRRHCRGLSRAARSMWYTERRKGVRAVTGGFVKSGGIVEENQAGVYITYIVPCNTHKALDIELSIFKL